MHVWVTAVWGRTLHAPKTRTTRAQCIDTPCVQMVLLGNSDRRTVMAEMGTFRIDYEVENPARPGERRIVKSALLVDTGPAPAAVAA